MADDRVEIAQRLDGTESRRRVADRGYFQGAPGTDAGGSRPSRPRAAARELDEKLQAGGIVRSERPLDPELAELAPKGDRRMGANPHANGGLLLHDLKMPDFHDHAVQVSALVRSRRAIRKCWESFCAMCLS
jgi:hypothetical protein